MALIFEVSNFQGGQADSKYEGIKNSSGYLQGIDFRTNSRAVTVRQKMKPISGATVVDKPIKFVEVGSNVFAFGNAGNIYKISGSTVTKVYTDAEGEILDADYFYGKLYWTTATNKLSRCDATSSDFDTDTDHNWKTLTTADYHSFYSVGNRLFIGNGRYVATVNNSGTYAAQSLDIESDWEIRCLNLLKPLLLIGGVSNGRSKVLTWDFINADESYEEVPGLEAGEISEFLEIAGGVAAFIGNKIYWYNGLIDDPLYDFGSTIAHGATTVYDNMIHLATSKGVYSFGKSNRNYPTVPALEYISSEGVDVDAIDAIHGTSSTLYLGWENGGSYGIDMIDTANKQSQGIIETLVLSEKGILLVDYASMYFDKLPTNCSIQLKYKRGRDSTWQVIKDASDNTLTTTDTSVSKDKVPLGLKCKQIQFQILLNTNSNDTPTFRGLEAVVRSEQLT